MRNHLRPWRTMIAQPHQRSRNAWKANEKTSIPKHYPQPNQSTTGPSGKRIGSIFGQPAATNPKRTTRYRQLGARDNFCPALSEQRGQCTPDNLTHLWLLSKRPTDLPTSASSGVAHPSTEHGYRQPLSCYLQNERVEVQSPPLATSQIHTTKSKQ